MKKYLIAILVLLIAVSAPIYADDSTVFTVEPSVNNGVVTVNIIYEDNKMMHSGELDFVYDCKKLELIDATRGAAIESISSIINDAYGVDRVKVAWASAEVLPEEGTVLTVKLKCIDDSFENSLLSIENFLVGNANGQTMKNVTISVKGVEGSTVYSGEVSKTEDKKGEKPVEDTKPEEAKPIEDSIPVVDETSKDESPEDKAQRFVDVKDIDWFFDSVNYVSANKLMSGVGVDMFAPNENLTRAMMVVVLHRLEGTPKGENSGFSDIEADSWYESAVNWAASSGIVNGVGEGRFEPHTNITREQIATILYNYSQSKDMVMAGATAILTPDSHKISDWALEAMGWAVGEELIQGKEDGLLDPQCEATRAEFATILMRYIEKIK